MKKYKGFTFIENLAIVTVLAVVIVLVLPKLMHFQSKLTKQLALRRAITNYQVVLTKELMGTSGLRTTADADEYLKYDQYRGIVDRFDVKNSDCHDEEPSSCSFTTNNGTKWVVSTPSKALISLKESQTPTLDLANNSNNSNIFIIPFEYINGNIKMLVSKEAAYNTAVNKTIDFINE